jgi:hypothetical protein
MLVFERFHVMFKKLIRGRKNMLVVLAVNSCLLLLLVAVIRLCIILVDYSFISQASLLNHYCLMIGADTWRLLLKEHEAPTVARGSTLSARGADPVDYQAYEVKMFFPSFVNFSLICIRLCPSPFLLFIRQPVIPRFPPFQSSKLSAPEFAKVQDLWAVTISGYDALRDRYNSS